MHRLLSLDKRCYRGQGHRLQRIRRSALDCPGPLRGLLGNTFPVLQSVNHDKCRRHHDRLDQHRARRRRSHHNRHGRCPPEKPATNRNVRGCFRRPWITISFIAAVQRTCVTQGSFRALRVGVNELGTSRDIRFTDEFSLNIYIFVNIVCITYNILHPLYSLLFFKTREASLPCVEFAEFFHTITLIDNVNSSSFDGHFRIIWDRIHGCTDYQVIQPIPIYIAGSYCVTEISAHLFASKISRIRHIRCKK